MERRHGTGGSVLQLRARGREATRRTRRPSRATAAQGRDPPLARSRHRPEAAMGRGDRQGAQHGRPDPAAGEQGLPQLRLHLGQGARGGDRTRRTRRRQRGAGAAARGGHRGRPVREAAGPAQRPAPGHLLAQPRRGVDGCRQGYSAHGGGHPAALGEHTATPAPRRPRRPARATSEQRPRPQHRPTRPGRRQAPRAACAACSSMQCRRHAPTPSSSA